MSKRVDRPLLIDMLQAGEQVLAYVKDVDLPRFLDNSMLQDAVAYRLQVIGEAANNVSDTLKDAQPDIDWFKITGLRHRIVHDYGRIDVETLYRITQKYVPPLVQQLTKLLGEV